MKRLWLASAVLVVLITNGSAIWHASRNRAEPSGGTLQLTELELPLQPIPLESSVTVLRLNWTTDRIENRRFGPTVWLGTNKLKELGFDCSVPVQSPKASRHYGAMPSRCVFLALKYQARAAETQPPQDPRGSRLTVVDAAQDAQILRERYSDLSKHALCRGTVRLALRHHDVDGGFLSPPQLVGWVEGLAPSDILVPRPVNRLLTTLHRTIAEDENAPPQKPRFAARVHWGRNYEPWIDQIQPLDVTQPHP